MKKKQYVPLQFERLDERVVFANGLIHEVNMSMNGHEVEVVGTVFDDRVNIRRIPPSPGQGAFYDIVANGVEAQFDCSEVNGFTIRTGSGADQVNIDPSVADAVFCDLGPGDDLFNSEGPVLVTVQGGSGSDHITGHGYLSGGDGVDYLTAKFDNNRVDSGSGRDRDYISRHDALLGSRGDYIFYHDPQPVPPPVVLPPITPPVNPPPVTPPLTLTVVDHIDDYTGVATYQADTVRLIRIRFDGVDGIFYQVEFNGVRSQLQRRADGVLNITTHNFSTDDPTLVSDLQSQGWLNVHVV